MARPGITDTDAVLLLDMLKKASWRYEDLSVATGFSKPTVTAWVKKMREAGLVRISGYSKDVRGRLFIREFAFGNAPDTPRPGSSDNAKIRMRAMRDRKKSNT